MFGSCFLICVVASRRSHIFVLTAVAVSTSNACLRTVYPCVWNSSSCAVLSGCGCSVAVVDVVDIVVVVVGTTETETRAAGRSRERLEGRDV